jgi:hypothetical protein
MSPATYRAPWAADLHTEIRRYLAAVDAFRGEGCELRWLPEQQRPRKRRARRLARD